ncbi:MAG: hypothetical protein PHD81_02105 [Candidatus Nanoarchaeia archaeon]|nr:hypothetical protein [Candidatus Nanoarchaeia archaeon]MDD5587883.1 hypothetical protein [Candidatus Nanoarchaeia archaeon]
MSLDLLVGEKNLSGVAARFVAELIRQGKARRLVQEELGKTKMPCYNNRITEFINERAKKGVKINYLGYDRGYFIMRDEEKGFLIYLA